MIADRLYTPKDGELIYHYCGPEAFIQIVETKTLWLSASHMLNDSTEREWGFSVFERAALLIEKRVGKEFTEVARSGIRASYAKTMAMTASFSLDADVLSQWRAYANDGNGFAIGFSKMHMPVPAKPLRVLYDEALQTRELLNNLTHVYEIEKSFGFRFDDEFKGHIIGMALDLSAYKNPFFAEEKEVRLVHAVGVSPGPGTKIIPLGARGRSGKKLSRPLKTRFRVRNGTVIPYVVVDYSSHGGAAPVKEVILGPCNPNTDENIEMFLEGSGITGVKIRRSQAPYRR